jgi:phosphatidylserine decarboxylase
VRIVKEGWPFILGCLVASDLFLLGSVFFKNSFCVVLAVLLFLATAFCVYFFRDPARVVPQGDRLILSPADGKIMEIVEGKDPIASEPVWILRIFLSVFEPHLQRSPIAGQVKAIHYKTGKFLDARDPKAAFENEQNRIEIVASPQPSPDGRGSTKNIPSPPQGETGASTISDSAPVPQVVSGRMKGEGAVVVTQIAGLIARRIVCWVKEGQNVQAGEKIGLIRFGSQVDMVIPKTTTLRVKAGDFVTAGDTVLAEL